MVKSVMQNVSDTARWVAEYRAREHARPDALFKDPYAAGLAGERGRIIAEEAKRSFGNGWFFIARTKLIDDLIATCLAEGCTRVVNLAAGFDTRPYRLDLPADLEWIEVDLPPLLQEKEQALAGETPRCRLQRVPADLADADARRDLLSRTLGGPGRTLVVTEGLLLYLEAPQVRELTSQLRSCQADWWITDIVSPTVVKMSAKAGRINNAPVVFGPPEGAAFFEQDGWKVESVSTQLSAAARWKRLSPAMRLLARLPEPDPRRPGRAPWGAVLRLGGHGSAGP
ncbi:class I SAM-dependent methyltransferase [Streptomyces armeniacus]|uniref:S-adenosyl-L-methionine-dependent methyltransferase n=1 Tax=Streptomyces armeniacus TaxID=83291 RepID=A0A345XT86_9ACTN|nr:SAM-dependent methyltransferase [Streptomyces armeniacus]AXK34852.1 class I SAM-dependent methyltransferase [Streptomyces armeniacus]